MILQLRHTTFITQSLKEIHSGRETGLIDTGPLGSFPISHFTHLRVSHIPFRGFPYTILPI